MIKKAIIPAAGLGTRCLPITKVVPKEMLPICGRPAIDFVVEEAIKSGIEEILIVVSRSKNIILDYYDRVLELEAHLESKNKKNLIEIITPPNVHIQYVRQLYPRGLGDAILLGKNFVGNEPFVVMLPDEIILNVEKPPLLQLMEKYEKERKSIIGLKKMEYKDLKNYGVINPSRIDELFYKITEVIEKPKSNPPSNLAVIGRYILDNKIFRYLEKVTPGVGGEIQLTDAINNMLEDSTFYGLEIEGDRYDIGKISDYVKLINFIFTTDRSIDY